MHKDIRRWFSRQFQKLKIALDADYSAQGRGNQQDQPRITLTDAAHDQEVAQRQEQQAATAARVFVNHPQPLRSNPPQVKRKPLPSQRKPLAATPSLATSPALSCRNDGLESKTDKELPDFLKPGTTDELVLQHDLKPPVPRNKQREDPDHAPRSWRDSYQQQSNAGQPRTLLPYTAYSGDFTNACRHTTFGAPEASCSSKHPATANTTASNDPDIPMNQVASNARFKKHYCGIENCDTPYMNNLAGMIPNPRPLSPRVPLAPSKCHRNFDEDSLPYRNYASKNGPSSNQCAASYQDVSRGRVQHPPPSRTPPPPPPPPPAPSPSAMQSPLAHHTATNLNEKPLPFPPTPTNPNILYSREEWLAMPIRKRFWIKFCYYWHDYLDDKPQPWQDG